MCTRTFIHDKYFTNAGIRILFKVGMLGEKTNKNYRELQCIAMDQVQLERVFGKRSNSVEMHHLFCLSVNTENSHNHQIVRLETVYHEINEL